MAVAFDAQSTAVFNVSGVAAMTLNNITVGSGVNRGLFFLIVWGNGTNPTVTACNWDDAGTPQAMTLVAGTQSSSGVSSMACAIYQLVAPTPGAKNLKISWTASPSNNIEAHAVAVSFTGVDQTTPTRNGATNFKTVATAPPATITIASAIGNQVLAGFEQQVAVWPGTACSGNEIAQQDSGPNFGTAYSYTTGGASVSPTATWAGNDAWVAFGCDVQAASGGAAGIPNKLIQIKQSITRASYF